MWGSSARIVGIALGGIFAAGLTSAQAYADSSDFTVGDARAQVQPGQVLAVCDKPMIVGAAVDKTTGLVTSALSLDGAAFGLYNGCTAVGMDVPDSAPLPRIAGMGEAAICQAPASGSEDVFGANIHCIPIAAG